jgi:hypothetical protein
LHAIFSPAKAAPFAGGHEPSRSVGLPKRPQAGRDLLAGKSHAFCRRARAESIGGPAETAAGRFGQLIK